MRTERELRLGQRQARSCPELREREASQIWPKFQIQKHLGEIRTFLFWWWAEITGSLAGAQGADCAADGDFF